MLDVSVIRDGSDENDFGSTAVGIVSPTVIKVVGCGGGGCNAVNNMIEAGIEGVDFISLNTDVQSLNKNKAPTIVQIGKKVACGRGAGMSPEIGEAAAKEEEETIKKILKGSNMIFITAGLGGGTGTGSAPIIAKIARELGILTVAVVTTPFEFEGTIRMSVAQEGARKLREQVDSLIIIPNQRVLEGEDKNTSATGAFKIVDDILRQAVKGISDIITQTGLINRDFKDVDSVMRGKGDAILGIGVGEGDNRAVDAATNAISNKLLADTRIDGARHVLIGIFGNEEVGIDECEEIAKIVTASADKDVRVLWGLYIDPTMGDKISATVIATGFKSPNEKISMEAKKENQDDSTYLSPDTFVDVINKPTAVLNESPKTPVQNGLFDEKNVESETVQSDSATANNGNLSTALKSSASNRSQNNRNWIGGDISTPASLRKAQQKLSRTINFGDR